jgi:23S rRNA (uracil1939-C5)-methyltransferase
MKKKEQIVENIRLGKLVHGGQCLSELPSGKKILVWGGLPGELVNVRIIKKKSSYAEGIVSEVLESSKDRVVPEEPGSFLSTSPWQIMSFELENTAKNSILKDAFTQEKIENVNWSPFVASASGREPLSQIHSGSGASRNPEGVSYYGYRNKQEFGFWGDEEGLHLAHFVRGTHHKQIVSGSKLALDPINSVAVDFIEQINRFAKDTNLRAGDLKTIVFRSSQAGEVVGAMYVKHELEMSNFNLPKGLNGLVVYYSDPKSPASVPTKKLYSFGDIKLVDEVLGINITYDVMSFFQVNIPVFELALKQMKSNLKSEKSIDMYSGVGTIGLILNSSELVESDKDNVEMAKINVKGTSIEVIHSTSEEALSYITDNKVLILDPPRAGLHKKMIDRIAEVRPMQIIYLSCNPSTQARDVKLLENEYRITFAQGFNFFPRTPHIESLVVLEKK